MPPPCPSKKHAYFPILRNTVCQIFKPFKKWYLFFNINIFQGSFRFLVKLSRMQSSHLPPDLTYTHSLPYGQHPAPDGRFVSIDEPTVTHHYHPESTEYIRGHSWQCTLCVFAQRHNDTHPPLWCHTRVVHCPINLPCSAQSPSPHNPCHH